MTNQGQERQPHSNRKIKARETSHPRERPKCMTKTPVKRSKTGRDCIGNNKTASQAIILDFVVKTQDVQRE